MYSLSQVKLQHTIYIAFVILLFLFYGISQNDTTTVYIPFLQNVVQSSMLLCLGLLSNQFLIIGPFTPFLLFALMNSTSMSRQVKTSFIIFENVILELISRKWIGQGIICIFSVSCPYHVLFFL